jgi:protein-disulfide isomerase
MRALILLISIAVAVTACGKSEAPATGAAPSEQAVEAKPTAVPVKIDPAKDGAKTKLAAAGSPRAIKPVALSPKAPPTPANGAAKGLRATAAQMKDLEKQPGATGALATTTAVTPKKHPDVVGKPGPSPASGSDEALVKIYIFSDFQCPVCKRVVEPAKAVARELGDKVQVIFKQNALEMHPNAFVSAAASMAAYKQDKFWEMHDKLFQNQRNLSEPDLLVYAEELGLDMDQFKKDMNSPELKEQIEYERNLAAALGMRGTPGFFINGHKIVGWGSYGGFRSVVNRALKAAEGVQVTTKTKAVDVARIATEKFSGKEGVKFAELVWGKK